MAKIIDFPTQKRKIEKQIEDLVSKYGEGDIVFSKDLRNLILETRELFDYVSANTPSLTLNISIDSSVDVEKQLKVPLFELTEKYKKLLVELLGIIGELKVDKVLLKHGKI